MRSDSQRNTVDGDTPAKRSNNSINGAGEPTMTSRHNVAQLVNDRAELKAILATNGGGPHYVYILRHPDGIECHGGIGTPFYVGIGQGSRVFAHEEEARDPERGSDKIEAIRSAWRRGQEIVRSIDSVHSQEPWGREEELINTIGRLADGTGPLTVGRPEKLTPFRLGELTTLRTRGGPDGESCSG